MGFDGGGQVYTVNVDGTGARQLTTGSASAFAPTFSLDGTRIAYWSAAGRCTTSLTTQVPSCVGPFSVLVMNVDGSSVATIDRDLVDLPDLTISWAPGGERFAYVKKVDGVSRIAVADTRRGTTTLIGDPAMDSSGPQWAPTGDRLAFVGSDASGHQAVYVIPSIGGPLARVAPPRGPLEASAAVWSPDGSTLAFFAHAGNGNHDIWRVAPDGTDLLNLTSSGVDEFFPVWSNAGTRIAYEEIDGRASVPQVNDVWVMNADGTGKRKLPAHDVTGAPLAWSPDDQKLLGYEAGLAHVLVISVDDSVPQLAIPAPGNNYGNGSFQRLAP